MLKITMKGRKRIKALRVLAAKQKRGEIQPDDVLRDMELDSSEHLKGLIMLGDGEWHAAKDLRGATCADVDKPLLAQGLAYEPSGCAPPSRPCKNLVLSKRASRKGKAKVRKPKTLGELRACSSR